jgi:hypothetical protein
MNSALEISRSKKGNEFKGVGRIRVTLGLDSRGQPHAYPRFGEVRIGHLVMQGEKQPSTIIGSIMSIMSISQNVQHYQLTRLGVPFRPFGLGNYSAYCRAAYVNKRGDEYCCN